VASGPTETAPTISTHVLDTELGRPAVGVHVTLYRLSDDGRPLRLTQALTDGDGRVRDLLERPLVAGDYRLEFALGPIDVVDTAPAEATADQFFRRVAIDLHVADTRRSYHVPLLLAPYSLTTYRGS
jgi:5-hydroxyisourate hydrolase